MTRLGFIGTGSLAGFFVEGLKRAGTGHDIFVSPRNREKAEALRSRFGVTIADNQEIADRCDLVVACVLPRQAVEVLSALRFQKGQTVLSVMSGVSLAAVSRLAQPADAAVSMMPGLANAYNCGPSVLYPDNAAARGLLATLGPVHVYDREETFMAASVMGAFSGMTHLMMRDAIAWFEAHGLAGADARRLVAEVLKGNADSLLASHLTMDEVAAGVVTPGGITEQGRKVLDQGGSLGDALGSVHRRIMGRT